MPELRRLSKSQRDLKAVINLCATLRSVPARAEMPSVILKNVLEMFDADGAALALMNPSNGSGVVELGSGALSNFTGMNLTKEDGLIGEAIRNQKLSVLSGDQKSPLLYEGEPEHGLKNVVCVPLAAREQVIGALVVGHNRQRKHPDTFLATAVAEIAANAIYGSTISEQKTRFNEKMTIAGQIGRTLSDIYNLPQIYHELGSAVQNLFPDVSVIFISLYDSETRQIHCAYGWNDGELVDPSVLPPVPLEPPGRGTQSEVIHSRQPLIINHLRDQLKKVHVNVGVGKGEMTQSGIYVPMMARGEVIGVVQAQSTRYNRFGPTDIELLTLVGNTAAVAIQNARLFAEQSRSNFALLQTYDETIEGWSRAMDLRDRETEGHTLRVTEMTMRLARFLDVPEEALIHIRRGALLHDMGKLGVPDAILNKPGKLTDDEWKVMVQHPQFAYEMLAPISYLAPALEIPYCHHEKWDGGGYPRGLTGENIPLAARIFAVIDVWDALTSDRPYRLAWTQEKTLAYLRDQVGKHFDPFIVEMFVQHFQEITANIDRGD